MIRKIPPLKMHKIQGFSLRNTWPSYLNKALLFGYYKVSNLGIRIILT